MSEVPGIASLLLRLVSWLPRMTSWIGARFRADHATLTSGWFAKAFSGHRHFYVNVACAPSRRRRFPLTPQAAGRFVLSVFPDAGFPDRPDQATKDYVVFEILDEPDGDRFLRMIRFYANGLIELTWRLPVRTGSPEAGAVLAVTDFLEPLSRMVKAVRAGLYAELYSRRPGLDWFFAVSPSVNHDRGWSLWKDLEFPGARPQNRATNQVPSISSQGYAPEALRKLSQRTKPERIMRAGLEDMLHQSGFYDTDHSVRESVSALQR